MAKRLEDRAQMSRARAERKRQESTDTYIGRSRDGESGKCKVVVCWLWENARRGGGRNMNRRKGAKTKIRYRGWRKDAAPEKARSEHNGPLRRDVRHLPMTTAGESCMLLSAVCVFSLSLALRQDLVPLASAPLFSFAVSTLSVSLQSRVVSLFAASRFLVFFGVFFFSDFRVQRLALETPETARAWARVLAVRRPR